MNTLIYSFLGIGAVFAFLSYMISDVDLEGMATSFLGLISLLAFGAAVLTFAIKAIMKVM